MRMKNEERIQFRVGTLERIYRFLVRVPYALILLRPLWRASLQVGDNQRVV